MIVIEKDEHISWLLRISTGLLLPLLLLFSAYLLFRGYQAPGGGFAGALVLAAAFSLDFMAFGVSRGRRALRISPLTLAGSGLVIAAVSGLFPLMLGKPLFTGVWKTFGRLEIGTPLLFEGGIYLIIAGSVLAMIFSLTGE